MAISKFIPSRRIKKYLVIILERNLLKKHFPFLKFQIRDEKLFCYGHFKPSEFSTTYYYKIEWQPGVAPKVFPINPHINYSDDIHVYKDGSLCLYYPKDFIYDYKTSHLHETIMPWTHEWFVFYELYLIKGRWLHPYVEHRKI